MRARIIGPIAALALAAGSAGAVAAETWRLDEAASSLTFSYSENGQTIDGAFAAFDGIARFGRADLSDASVTVDVETASVAFEDPLREHFAKSIDWFDVENHPAAQFELDHLTPLGGDRHRAEGTLEIRGVRRPVEATLSVDRENGALTAAGQLTFPRTEFGVGTGFSSLFAEVGDLITVHFDFVGERVD